LFGNTGNEYAAVSLWDDCIDFMTAEKTNAENVTCFLRQACKALKDEFIVTVLDGASSHKSKKLMISKNVALIKVPPYSPGLSPAEQRLFNC
jgi:transposase